MRRKFLGHLLRSKSVEASNLWTRPSAKTAARNLRRARFAALKKFGAGEQLVNRLTDGDIPAIIQELKQQAQRGEASASNILYYMARFNCAFARINQERWGANDEQYRVRVISQVGLLHGCSTKSTVSNENPRGELGKSAPGQCAAATSSTGGRVNFKR